MLDGIASEESYSEEIGQTAEGTRQIRNIFGQSVFECPKPVSLLKLLVEQSTRPGDIVLDFFAGSATTAQAVMELNAEDGGDDQETARSLSLPRYFTGKPCKWGHVSERWVKGGTCITCHHARRGTDEWHDHMSQKYLADEAYREGKLAWLKQNRPRIREQRRERYRTDPAYREAKRLENARRGKAT